MHGNIYVYIWCNKFKQIRSKPLRCDSGSHRDMDKKGLQDTLLGLPGVASRVAVLHTEGYPRWISALKKPRTRSNLAESKVFPDKCRNHYNIYMYIMYLYDIIYIIYMYI